MTLVYLWSERLHLGEELQKQKLEEKVENIIERVTKRENRLVKMHCTLYSRCTVIVQSLNNGEEVLKGSGFEGRDRKQFVPLLTDV